MYSSMKYVLIRNIDFLIKTLIIYFEAKQVQVTNFVIRRLPTSEGEDWYWSNWPKTTNKSTKTFSSPDSAEVSDLKEQTKTLTPEANGNDICHFQSKLLTLHPWVEFDGTKMFCKHCKQFGMQNIFTTGNTNFRTSTLTRHIASNDNQRVIMTPQSRKTWKKIVENVHNKEEKAIVIAMKAVSWLSKKGIALSKYSKIFERHRGFGHWFFECQHTCRLFVI